MEEANPDHSRKPPVSSFPQQRNEELPFSSSLEQRDKELGLCVIQNEATDCTRVICDSDGTGARLDHGVISHESSLAVHPFPWENMRGRYQAYSQGNLGTSMNLMTNSTQYNSFVNPQVRSRSINSGGGVSFLHRPVSAFPCPEGDMNRLYQSYTHDNRAISENLMNGATHFNNFQSPQIDQNFLTGKCNAAGGFQMNREGGEANSADEYRSQINRDFVNLAGSNPGLYHTPGNRELGVGNSSMVSAVNSNFQEHMDGSFLTLGIGGNAEVGYKSIVYNNEINDRSERLVFPQLNASHGGKTNITSSNPVHNMVGSFSSLPNYVGGFSSLGHNIGGRIPSNNDLGGSVFPQLNIPFGQTTNRSSFNPHNVDGHFSSWQNDVGEFLNPTHNMGSWASSNNDFGAICGTGSEPHFPSLCQTLQTPQVDGQQYLPMPNNRNLGLGVNIDPQSANIDPYGFQGYPTVATRPISSSQAGVLDFGLPNLSELLAESAKTKRIIAQPTPDQLQERYMNLRNFSPGSSLVSPSVWGIEGTARQEQSGELFSTYEGSATPAFEGHPFQKRREVQLALQLFPPNEVIAAQTTEGGLFPKRIGVQSTSRTQDRGPVQSTKDLLGPAFTSGQGITVAKGHGLPSRDHHGHPLADGQVIPVVQRNVFSQTANVFDVPSRKRSAVQPPPVAPCVPRRKARPQPSIRPSIPLPVPMPRPSIGPSTPLRARLAQPSINPFVPSSAAPHVKWQGFDGSPELSGLKCLICKRDVSYAPEGHIFQPAIPPAVAVLPCGHIFHDHCLQLITPKDQSKDPPCIPCAIGET